MQTVGHIPVDVNVLNCDLLSLSGHKFYGPKGVGALYVRRGTKIASYLFGGDQERGRRASTQNVAGIVGMGKALALCTQRLSEEAKTQIVLRDRIIDHVLTQITGSRLNGHRTERLVNNAHFSFEGIDGESLLMSLDMKAAFTSMDPPARRVS